MNSIKCTNAKFHSSITILCGTDSVQQNILHIPMKYGGIFHEILSVPQNIVMDLNNIMNLEFLAYFEHVVQSFRDTCILVSVLGFTPRDMPLKYRCRDYYYVRLKRVFLMFIIPSHHLFFYS